jgi:hypothetical protein
VFATHILALLGTAASMQTPGFGDPETTSPSSPKDTTSVLSRLESHVKRSFWRIGHPPTRSRKESKCRNAM